MIKRIILSLILCGGVIFNSFATSDFNDNQNVYYAILSGGTTVKITYPNTSKYSPYGSGASTYTKPTGDIIIPKTIEYNSTLYTVVAIEEYAFSSCSNITNITFAEGIEDLTTIGNSAFASCSKLESIEIPSCVTSIGSYAFSGCSKLNNATLSSITTIQTSTFSGCTSLTSFTIPSSVTSIQSNAFSDCGLTSIIIPSTVTTLSSNAFMNCSNLESVTFASGTGIATLSSDVFKGCSRLQEVNFLNTGLKTIQEKAFENCTALETITIPASVTSISANPFYGCSSLNEIIVAEGNKTYNSGNGANCIISTANSLIVGCNGTVIPNTVTSINTKAFNYCTGLTEITIPSSVNYYSNYMFEGCSNLRSITINTTTPTALSNYAFHGCTSLTSFNIPSGITTIGNNTFQGCSSLTNITIPSQVTSIGQQAFYECATLTEVTVLCENTSLGLKGFNSGYSTINPELKIYVPSNKVDYYKGATNWSSYESIIYGVNVFKTTGNWSDIDNWSSSSAPVYSDYIAINAACTIPNDYTATADKIVFGNNGSLTIADGGQLILPKTSTGVQATVKKETYAATAKDAKSYYWYAISSAVDNPNILSATNLTTGTYDLYRYNEAATEINDQGQILYWENYKASHADFTTLEPGRGYLYRNTADLSIEMTGEINVADFNYSVTNSGGVLAGFNLIGNPYSHDIYKGAGTAIPNGSGLLRTGFYYMDPTTGKWTAGTDNSTAIKPNEAILVQTDKDGNIAMTNTTASAAKYNNDNIMFKVANSQYSDEAYAWFDKGRGLNKINHRNAEVPMLYINQDGENYAIATMSDDTKTFSLNLKAMTTGKYTLSYKTKGEFSYLHVIDRFTGEDVDMLLEGEYSFVASPIDNDARFIVRLEYTSNYGDTDSSVFAYQNGNDIIVSGEGELQVFDVTGRKVMSAAINSSFETISGLSKGFYIFKLNEKTQKIVVR